MAYVLLLTKVALSLIRLRLLFLLIFILRHFNLWLYFTQTYLFCVIALCVVKWFFVLCGSKCTFVFRKLFFFDRWRILNRWRFYWWWLERWDSFELKLLWWLWGNLHLWFYFFGWIWFFLLYNQIIKNSKRFCLEEILCGRINILFLILFNQLHSLQVCICLVFWQFRDIILPKNILFWLVSKILFEQETLCCNFFFLLWEAHIESLHSLKRLFFKLKRIKLDSLGTTCSISLLDLLAIATLYHIICRTIALNSLQICIVH